MKIAVWFLIPFTFVVAQTSKVDKDARVGFASIKVEDLKKFDTYLSSDQLQGRETSYPGEKLAAAYIAEHFKSLGLKPVGDNGTYFQHYSVEVERIGDESSIIVDDGPEKQTFSWFKDFLAIRGRDTSVTGNVAFVGYMDNRIAESDRPKLVGKVVVALAGPRSSAKDTAENQVMVRIMGAFRRDQGSVATLVVVDDVGAGSYARLSAQFGSFGLTRGQMRLKGEASTRPTRPAPLLFYVSPEVASAILRPSGMSLAELRDKAFRDSAFAPMMINNALVTINAKAVKEEREAENVVGLLEGSDPILKKEVVVFSAHFDHLGVGANGAIYHGADDDGSGTSMVMELAQAFTKNPVRPRRSLLFLTVSGEEKGLLGSTYYTSHPLVPLEQTMADFNTDMIGRMDTTHERTKDKPYTYLIGSDKISTELDSVLQVANNESNNIQLDYTYNDPKDPNRYYMRSDHYNFAKKGVPIAFFFTGNHVDYHRPTDTVDKILFDRMATIGQVVYYAGWKAANFNRMFVRNVTSSEYR